MKSLLLSFLFCASLGAEIIPSTNRVTWQGNVGIPGGVPIRSTIYTSLTEIDDTGATDVRSAIQTALDACPSNQVVFIPSGTYRIENTLYIKTGITLRGAGPTSTTFQFYTSNNKIDFGASDNTPRSGPYRSITGSPAKGASSITLSTTPGSTFVVGNLMWMDQLNDGSIPLGDDLVTIEAGGQTCTHCSRSSGTRAMSQIVEITDVTGNVVSFDPPLYWGFTSSLSPEASGYAPSVQWAGVEDLKVSVMQDGGGDNFAFNGAKYCWVKGVEGDYTAGDHAHTRESYRLEIRDSYFHDCYNHTSPGQRESSLMWGDTCASLYENNIIRRTFIGMYVNWGSAGNVFAYNLITNSFNSGNNAMYGSINWHGAHPMMNLFEGNVINRFFQDGVWGSASHETLHRNFVSGVDTWTPPGSGRSAEEASPTYWPFYGRSPMLFAWQTRHFNIVGNAIGSEGFKTNWVGGTPSMCGPGCGTPFLSHYDSIPPGDPEPTYENDKPVWGVGYSSDGSEYDEGSNAWDSLLKHLNWDVVRDTLELNGGIADTNLVDSLYQPSKPSWFGDLNYPPILPRDQAVHLDGNQVPARARWNAYVLSGDPEDLFTSQSSGSSGAPTVNVNALRIGTIQVAP